MDGEVQCFTGGHLPLAILAVVVLTLCAAVIPFILFLLSWKERVSLWHVYTDKGGAWCLLYVLPPLTAHLVGFSNAFLGEIALVTKVNKAPDGRIQIAVPLVVSSWAWPKISSYTDGGSISWKHGIVRSHVGKSVIHSTCVCVCDVPSAVSCVLRCVRSDGCFQLCATVPNKICQPSWFCSLGQYHCALSVSTTWFIPDPCAI